MKFLRAAGLSLALVVPAAPSVAAESVNLILNWTPTADHSPFYYAKAQGWYEKAGIDLSIESGKGSGVSSLKVGSGGAQFGIACDRCARQGGRGHFRWQCRQPGRRLRI